MGGSKDRPLAEVMEREAAYLILRLERDHRPWAPQLSRSWALIPGELGEGAPGESVGWFILKAKH